MSEPNKKEKEAIQENLGHRAGPRQTVAGEHIDPDKMDIRPIDKFLKSDEDQQRIYDMIKPLIMFRHLDDAELNDIIEAMAPRIVQKGQLVIREGDPGDYLYVVAQGDFVAKRDKDEAVLAEYHDKGVFGELALLHNQPRGATVVARTRGRLWALGRRAFTRLVVLKANQRRNNFQRMIDSVAEFKTLSLQQKMNLVDALRPCSVEQGRPVVVEGKAADGMFFVVDGQLDVTVRGQHMRTLFPGDYFGELALITKRPRAATVTAKCDCKLAFLETAAFERLLGPCKELMQRRIASYKK